MTQSSSIQEIFCRHVAGTLHYHDMVHPKDTVLMGISGGPDSMALARVLLCLAPKMALGLGVAHLNHGLRGRDAHRDQAFAKKFAAGFNLPFYCEQIDTAGLAEKHRISLEEAGRNARYDFFVRVAEARGYHRVATGHTKDDNAEQVLMALLRGSGAKGMAGIPPVREHRFIRPLIDRSRKEIVAFLDDLDQPYVTDDSNEDPAFLRNRIRNQLLPLLEKSYNPGIMQGLHRISRMFYDENRFMDDHAGRAFDTCLEKKEPGAVYLSLQSMQALHPALLPRVLRCGIRIVKADLRQITYDHIQAIQDLMFRAGPGKHLDLPGRIRVYKARDRICIKKEGMPLRQLGKSQKQFRQAPSKA
jgi:tRNA(Ile)-lysidine synthase